MAIFICELSEKAQKTIETRAKRYYKKNNISFNPDIMKEKISTLFGSKTTSETIKMDDILTFENNTYLEA